MICRTTVPGTDRVLYVRGSISACCARTNHPSFASGNTIVTFARMVFTSTNYHASPGEPPAVLKTVDVSLSENDLTHSKNTCCTYHSVKKSRSRLCIHVNTQTNPYIPEQSGIRSLNRTCIQQQLAMTRAVTRLSPRWYTTNGDIRGKRQICCIGIKHTREYHSVKVNSLLSDRVLSECTCNVGLYYYSTDVWSINHLVGAGPSREHYGCKNACLVKERSFPEFSQKGIYVYTLYIIYRHRVHLISFRRSVSSPHRTRLLLPSSTRPLFGRPSTRRHHTC